MGKNEKTALGRTLVKHHNQMIQQSKEKGRFYKNQQKKVLESVTDVNIIDAVIQQADEDALLFSDPSNPKINLDPSAGSSLTPEQRREEQKKEEALHAGSLRIPRRPPWTPKMTVEELDANERQAFLIWRRSLVRLEENEKLVLTPFEKNLDIWRQLWRVVERSDLLVMVVDARDPLFYRCPDLETYVREVDKHKRTLLLINKADLLPLSIRKRWAKYFRLHDILFVFWSAKAASAALEGKKFTPRWETQKTVEGIDDSDTRVYRRDELLARLQSEAEDIAARRNSSSNSLHSSPINSVVGNTIGNPSFENVIVGFVGYPNVGKSSTINALVGEKRTGVTSTPGKTKHFQTLVISDKLTLCDCPGLVFPSFSSSRYEMIASGVLPIDRMTEHREAVQVVANRVPRHAIEKVYNITLPRPKAYESQSRPPLASEFLRAYCASRGYVASSGLPDETRAARQILKDYIDGKLPHFEMPPEMPDEEDGAEDEMSNEEDGAEDEMSSEEDRAEDFTGLDLSEDHDPETSDNENTSDVEGEGAPSLEHVLNDLDSFDMDNGLASKQVTGRKKPQRAAHKLHKKPQKKKDRSWRVGNDGSDGTPAVRVFQKPVNTGPRTVD